MSTQTLTTELEAINTMLDGIGESPISSLEVSGLVEVAKARALLNEVSIAAQSTGWHFNTENDYPLVRDTAGMITLPRNAIQVDTSENQSDIEVTQRGLRLYDRKNHTYTFSRDLKADIVFYLDWNDLPQAARRYIMIRAARVFQARELGSETLHRYSESEEAMAYSDLRAAEGNVGDYNMFNGSWSVASILDR